MNGWFKKGLALFVSILAVVLLTGVIKHKFRIGDSNPLEPNIWDVGVWDQTVWGQEEFSAIIAPKVDIQTIASPFHAIGIDRDLFFAVGGIKDCGTPCVKTKTVGQENTFVNLTFACAAPV